MDDKVMEDIYQEKLEERIIAHLAEKHAMDYQTAMKVFYTSALADKIHVGKYGIQYLDYKVLVEILEETEPELFGKESRADDGKSGGEICLK